MKRTLQDRFQVTCVGLASDARKELASKAYDLIVLDVALPDGDGFALCSDLKKTAETRSIPVLFLTGKGSVTDKVNGFSLGADDYIVKPFEPLELRARVEARLRPQTGASGVGGETLQRGDLKLSVAYQKAFLESAEGARDLQLTPIEFKLLYTFIRNEGKVVSRTELLSSVWGGNVHVIDRIIDRHVCSLRQKMAPRSGYVETVPREGYRFKTR